MDVIRPNRQVFVECSLVVFRIALFLVLSAPATWAFGQADCWYLAANAPTETLGVRLFAHGVIKRLPSLAEMLEFLAYFWRWLLLSSSMFLMSPLFT